MSKLENEVFISYAWGGESERIVNEIDKTLQQNDIKLIRDKRNLGFKGSVKEFMERIGRGNCVVVVISDKYLRSENCMFELMEIAENQDFQDRIFPIVLQDANIYKAINRIKYIKYWEDQIVDLDAAIKTVNAANLQGITDDINLYTKIRATISSLADTLKDMNTLTPEMHENSDFTQLIEALAERSKATPEAHHLVELERTEKFIVLGNLEVGRYHHISVLQPNGGVLIVGGYSDDNIEAKVLASAELFNIDNRTSTPHGRMTERRYFAAATLLDNNTLLISGGVGENGQILDTAELYSFSTGKFLLTGPMTISRRGHTAIKLQNGKVLIGGGSGGDAGLPLASTEIYDPIENNFTVTGSMNQARLTEHTPNAVLLKDGRVLIAGGYDGISGAIASMEFYDPDKGVFGAAGNMALKRAAHTLTLLSDGKVLIAGGYADESGHLVSAEVYDPTTDKTMLIQNMKVPHFHHSATLLPDDRVLIIGGNSSLVEVYNPKLNAFSEIGNLNHSRHLHTAILTHGGQVLVIGGAGSTNSSKTIEISPMLVSAGAA